MKCAWQELMRILPPWIETEMDSHKDTLQEIRLRLGQSVELITRRENFWLHRKAAEDDLNFCINKASRYSPWSAQTMAQGFVTAPGGHRIGICGEAVMQADAMTGIRRIDSLNIRVARDFPGIGASASNLKGSILLLGPPGSGKTTLLRDIIRQISENQTVGVVDERGELFPAGFLRGKRMDVMTGCKKTVGMETVLRTMGPDCIAVDEITSEADCKALIHSAWCGVRLIATAHASSIADLQTRSVYRPLLDTKLFSNVLVLDRDKSWRLERMDT